MTNNAIRKMLFVLLGAIIGIPMAVAQGGGGAGWVLNPGAMYLMDSSTTGGQTTTTSRYLVDLSLGYKFESPFYLGAEYSIDNTSVSSNSSTTTQNYTDWGPSLGLVTDNLFLLFTYFVSGQYDNGASGGTTSYTNGTGFSARLGYRFTVGSSFSVGPMLAYRSLSYTSVKNPNGSTGTADYKDSHLLPYVVLWFNL